MPAPVVFLVLSHHRPALVERLAGRLADTETAITVVHHEPKAARQPVLPAGGRALSVPGAISVQWGRMTLVDALVLSMRWIVDTVGDFSWIVVLSGQDYPLVSARRIEAELQASPADAFMRWEFVPPFPGRLSTPYQRASYRRHYWWRVPGTSRYVPLLRPSFYRDGVGMYGGSVWSTFGRRAVERILGQEAMRTYLRDRRLRRMLVPDESFFQTVLMNAPHGLDIVNDDRRFYRFLEAGGAPHAEVLTMGYLDELRQSRAHFARKFEEGASGELLDHLDELAAG